MLTIDGSTGEGGGQILRSSLALSLCLGQPFRIVNIRSRRRNPGLGRQHLVAVQAAAEVGRAEVTGAGPGSGEITFAPRGVWPGDYRFSIGSAGSTGLVLQTVLPALLTAKGPTRLVLEGGTHNPHAPPFEALGRAFLPLIGRMGASVSVTLARYGFYPAGGGRIEVRIDPVECLRPVELDERGRVLAVRGSAAVADLPAHIAEREARVLAAELGLDPAAVQARRIAPAVGPGNVVTVVVESEHVTEVFTGFGRRGVPAERVASDVAGSVKGYLDAGVPVGEHLADQLLLPIALTGGGSFVTQRPTLHATTNALVIERFTGARIRFDPAGPSAWRVTHVRASAAR
jgi:RNA 3'-terminal phosphate cyclase (ATP)